MSATSTTAEPPVAEPDVTARVTVSTPADPIWARFGLVGLLLGTAVLYLWRLADSGYANSFYSAAVQASTQSWKALFFGSFDSSNFITVDKPPVALWVMDLSARLFGVNAWSILVPQAVEGVLAVALLYVTVRRYAGSAAGLLAGAVLALTPVAVLMFRFNNPDALLTLLLVAAAYTFLRGLERAGTWWLLATSALLGTAFITKMAQALIVVPVLVAVYLVAAPTPVRRRVVQLGAALAALVAASGWWVAIVELTPASSRPYIGGSQDNSLLNLMFGYNGFGRLTGNETGSVGGGGTGGGQWGSTGWDRLFGSQMGTQISWLIPAALLFGSVVLWRRWDRPRTDMLRAAVLVFGGWLLLTGLVFSYAQGIIHPYYTVVLAPPVGALVGIGAVVAWRARREAWARYSLAGAAAASGLWAYELLGRTPGWYPELRIFALLGGLVAAVGLLRVDRLAPRLAAAVVVVAVAAAITGPAAFALDTAATPHSGSLPTAGPASGGIGGGGRGAPAGGPGGSTPPTGGQGWFTPPTGGQGFAGRTGGTRGAGGGGLLNAATPSSAMTRLLEQDAGRYRWVAATVGANNAAGYQLATGDPVMAIGGFNGSDPAPTLAQFKAYVRQGLIHYFIAQGSRGGGVAPGGNTASAITSWVKKHYESRTVGGVTVYDLG